MTLEDASVKVEWNQALNVTKWGTMKQPLASTSALAESQSKKKKIFGNYQVNKDIIVKFTAM